MDYKNELQKLLEYCKESAGYITDEDCTEDKHARMAYRDVIGEIEKIFEREQESSDESAALPLHDVVGQSEQLPCEHEYGIKENGELSCFCGKCGTLL